MNERASRVSRLVTLYRFEKGKTYKDIASEMGITAQALYQKRKGISPWLWSEVLELSDMMQLPLDAFK